MANKYNVLPNFGDLLEQMALYIVFLIHVELQCLIFFGVICLL